MSAEPSSLGRRRNAWDTVRELQRRERAAADADWDRRVDAADPDRPLDVWRVSGLPVVPPLRPRRLPTASELLGRLRDRYTASRNHAERAALRAEGRAAKVIRDAGM